MPFSVRDATAADRPFVLDTVRRLAAFGPPPWRTAEEVVAGEVRSLERFFATPDPGARLLIAHDAAEGPAAFAYLEVLRDYFSGETHGHLGILAVAGAAEGRGAGAALLRAAEDWARAQGFRMLTLNTFEGNARARRLYEHFDYRIEILRYVKLIDG